jgi:GntR family transcriptional regulator
MSEIDPIGSPEYTYVQVANAIKARIKAGEITHRLPAERALARELGVAYQTLRSGMDVLRGDGVIVTRQGRGTFVAPAAGSLSVSVASPGPSRCVRAASDQLSGDPDGLRPQ